AVHIDLISANFGFHSGWHRYLLAKWRSAWTGPRPVPIVSGSYVFFRPSRANPSLIPPTAYAVDSILAPLRGSNHMSYSIEFMPLPPTQTVISYTRSRTSAWLTAACSGL